MIGFGCNSTSDAKLQYMTCGEVRQLALESEKNPDRLLLVDPRSPWEYANGHIPTARNVALDEVQPNAGKVAAFSKYETIVVYGNDPNSVPARGLAKRFMANAYSDVWVLEGGLKEWRAQGGEIATSDQPPPKPN